MMKTEGASKEAIELLQKKYPLLPDEYIAFLLKSNGAEDSLGVEPGWYVIWPAEEVLVATDEYQMPEYLPGYIAFGGNGGGELFVFSEAGLSSGDQAIYMVPAIGMDKRALKKIASNFTEFESEMGKESDGEA